MRETTICETTYRHISGSDSLPIAVLRIEPAAPENIKGIVQLVHGKNEHKGRYAAFMRYLAQNGYIAIINDHRGHGESVYDANDRGYWYEGGYQALIEDLHEITLEVKQYAAEKCGRNDFPVIMIGHSMGSLAARCYIRKYDADIDKLCIIGSPSRSNMIKQGLSIIKLLEKFEGKKYRSRLAKRLIMGVSYELRFWNEHLHNAWTNSEREAVIEHNNDPMCNFLFTNSGYEQMLKLSMLTYSGDYVPHHPDMPIRFFSGKDDPCALSIRKFVEAMRFLSILGYTDVRCRFYPGMRHDILHERYKYYVYNDILKFIEKQDSEAV